MAEYERLLDRLGATPEEQLEPVLAKLLPAVLPRLAAPSPGDRAAIMALLSHVNTRVKARPAIKLPLLPLAQLYANSNTAPTVRAFALVYAAMALDRAPPADQVAAVPSLMAGLASRPAEGGATAMRLAVAALAAGAPALPAGGEAFLGARADARAVLAFFSTLLLYQPPGRKPAPPPPPASALQAAAALQQAAAGAAAAAARQQAGDGEGAAPPPRPDRPPPLSLPDGRTLPGGLTPADVAAIEGGAPPPDRATLVARKRAALAFVASRAFTAAVGGDAAAADLAPDLAYLYAVAAADADDGVARTGEDLLKKAMGDGPAATDVLETPALVRRLLTLVIGGTPSGLDAEAPPVPDPQTPLPLDWAAPAPPQLAARALNLLSRARRAAAEFPAAARAVDVTVFGGGAPPAVAAAGAEFLVWTLRHAPDAALAPRAAAVLARLLAAVERGGDGDAGAVAASARAAAYQAVAALARRAPACLAAAGPDAARTLFSSLAAEPPGVRAAAQEAVASAAAAYAGVTGPAADALSDLLLDAASADSDPAVRLCAATWAARLFPRAHLPSRWVCVLAAGDAALAVREAGDVGLFAGADDRRGAPLPDAARRAKRTLAGDTKEATPPPVDPLAPRPADAGAPPAVADLVTYAESRAPGLTRPPAVGAAAAAGAAAPPLAPGPFRALVRFAAECRAADAAAPPPAVYLALLDAAIGPSCPAPLRAAALAALVADAAAGHAAALAQRYATGDGAELLRRELGGVDARARRDAAQLVALAAEQGDAAAALASLTAAAAATTGRFEARDGALSALGFLLARPAGRADAAAVKAAVAALVAAATGADTGLAATAVAAVGVACLGGALPDTDAVSVLETALKHKEPAVASAAALALGRAAAGDPPSAPRAAAALLALATAKPPPPETVVTSAADGLVWAFGGHGAPLTAPLVGDGRPGGGARAAGVLGAAPAAPPVETTPPPEGTARARTIILDALLGSGSKDAPPPLALATQAAARAAAAAWIAALLTTCGRAAELRTRPRLEAAQRALTALLADGSDAAADAAPRGLVAIFALAPDDDTRAALVAGLSSALAGAGAGAGAGASTTTTTTAIKADADTQLFEPGALGSAPPAAGGGALTTLGEINALATDAGDPSLVYKFLALAAAGRDARAASGAALSLAALATALGPRRAELAAALLPRVWRAAHDPAPAVRDAMASILAALTDGDERGALNEHGDAILAGLLTDATARAWRSREAACRAAVALLSAGPPSVRAGPALASIVRVALRCADDVKPSVRAAGAALLRAARGAALKTLDKSGADPAAAAAVVAALLPPLVDALPTAAQEVRGAMLDVVASLTAAAPPAALAPLAPTLVPPFIEALSALEDARLNELEQHVSALGLDGSALETARVAASSASKPAAVLDACLAAVCDDAAAVAALAPALADALKRGVGAASRAGAARFTGALAARAPAAAVRPVARKLLSALLTGGKAGGGAAVRGAYASAAAAVARAAPDKDVADYVAALATLGGDAAAPAAHRELAAVAALALHRGAAPAAAAAAFTPIAFTCRHDGDAGVQAAWAAYWDEAAPGVGAAWRAHGGELAERVATSLAAPQHAARQAAALALAEAAPVAGDALIPHADTLADALAGALGGAYWDGKESVATAAGALTAAAGAAAPDAAARVGSALIAAAKRPKPAFAGAALDALAVGASRWPTAVAGDAFTVAVDGLAAAAAAAADKPATATDGDDPPARPPPAAAAAAAVAALAPVAPPSALTPAAADAAAAILTPGRPWADRVAAAGAAAAMAKAAGAPPPAWVEATILPALVTATEEPKILAVREKGVDALGVVATALRGSSAGDAAAAALRKVAAGDGNEAVKARAAAAVAKIEKE